MGAVYRDLGITLMGKALIQADASAALGVVQRKGAGAIRHLETRLLWVQEQEIKKKIEYIKIAGTINPADLGTKHLDGESMKRHLKSCLEFRERAPGGRTRSNQVGSEAGGERGSMRHPQQWQQTK